MDNKEFALQEHEKWAGKIEVISRAKLDTPEDLAVCYTPGVAEHMCMTMRGVQKPGSKTVTTIVRGAFAEDFSLQQTFLQMVKG